jgi:hypothetical protein
MIPAKVEDLFEKLALEISAKGFNRYSSDAIMHRIRWHFQVEKGERDFKCNNNWTPVLARWFMHKHPEYAGFFETRRSGEAQASNC